MNRDSATDSGPKFYYGAGKIRGVGRSFRPCILDVRDGSFRMFDLATDLRRAIEAMISVVGPENEKYQIRDLPGEGIPLHDQREEFEDEPYDWNEREDEHRGTSVCNLSSLHLTKRGELRNMRREEDTCLFFQKEEAEQSFSAITGASQQVVELRNFDELEPADKESGPYYKESDFTSDSRRVPEHLREKYSLLNLGHLSEKCQVTLAQVEVIRTEVSIAFHPEEGGAIMRIYRKSRGLSGFTNIEPRDLDFVFDSAYLH